MYSNIVPYMASTPPRETYLVPAVNKMVILILLYVALPYTGFHTGFFFAGEGEGEVGLS